MEIIIHRVNSINFLKEIPRYFGTEIDIRAFGSKLILNHEPFQNGEDFDDYLDEFNHGTLILNIKEAGIENEVLRRVRLREKIKSYFLLDVEFPYLYRASRDGEKSIAVRYSEDESIDTVKKYFGKVDWLWIDTLTTLPITHETVDVFTHFKTCLVCPERWGRPNDIQKYKSRLSELGISLDAVMTASMYASNWHE